MICQGIPPNDAVEMTELIDRLKLFPDLFSSDFTIAFRASAFLVRCLRYQLQWSVAKVRAISQLMQHSSSRICLKLGVQCYIQNQDRAFAPVRDP